MLGQGKRSLYHFRSNSSPYRYYRVGKRAPEFVEEISAKDFIEKRYPGMEFVGKRFGEQEVGSRPEDQEKHKRPSISLLSSLNN